MRRWRTAASASISNALKRRKMATAQGKDEDDGQEEGDDNAA
jgi:hypothetical protein